MLYITGPPDSWGDMAAIARFVVVVGYWLNRGPNKSARECPLLAISTKAATVEWDRGADRASNDADVSSILPIIPYGGFSSVRRKAGILGGTFPKRQSA
jgi:hypothetical protein